MEDAPESSRVRILSPGQRAQAAAAVSPPAGPLRRILAGLPSALADLVTAGVCLATWWAPQAMPQDFVRVTALVMVIEFLSIHGTIMLPIIAWLVPGRLAWLRPVPGVLLYAGFAAGTSLALQTWWPTVFFAWLLLSRYLLPRWNPGSHDEHIDSGALWLVSLLLWLLLLFVTLFLPVPGFGWDAAAVIRHGLPGTGIWVEQPQRLLAFASGYFLLLAAYKLSARPTR